VAKQKKTKSSGNLARTQKIL